MRVRLPRPFGRLMRIEGASMTPTLRPDSLVWVDERWSARGELRRGDIVAVRPTSLGGRACVKRIAGLPHERVTYEGQMWDLGHDEYFLLGDHLDDSLDSRRLGPIHRNELMGRVTAAYWPLPIRHLDTAATGVASFPCASVPAVASVHP